MQLVQAHDVSAGWRNGHQIGSLKPGVTTASDTSGAGAKRVVDAMASATRSRIAAVVMPAPPGRRVPIVNIRRGYRQVVTGSVDPE